MIKARLHARVHYLIMAILRIHPRIGTEWWQNGTFTLYISASPTNLFASHQKVVFVAIIDKLSSNAPNNGTTITCMTPCTRALQSYQWGCSSAFCTAICIFEASAVPCYALLVGPCSHPVLDNSLSNHFYRQRLRDSTSVTYYRAVSPHQNFYSWLTEPWP